MFTSAKNHGEMKNDIRYGDQAFWEDSFQSQTSKKDSKSSGLLRRGVLRGGGEPRKNSLRFPNLPKRNPTNFRGLRHYFGPRCHVLLITALCCEESLAHGGLPGNWQC